MDTTRRRFDVTRGTAPVLVLFDVDETLVHTGGSGTRSWKAAFEKLYDVPADIGEHSAAGETDPQVALATFRGVLGRDPAHDELAKLYAPRRLVLAIPADASDLPPALKNKAPKGEAIAYICRGTTCSAPIDSLSALAQDLGDGARNVFEVART